MYPKKFYEIDPYFVIILVLTTAQLRHYYVHFEHFLQHAMQHFSGILCSIRAVFSNSILRGILHGILPGIAIYFLSNFVVTFWHHFKYNATTILGIF
jgi:hypothetical protein